MYLFHWKKVNTQWLRTQALDLDKEEHIKQHKLTPGQQFTYFLMPILFQTVIPQEGHLAAL